MRFRPLMLDYYSIVFRVCQPLFGTFWNRSPRQDYCIDFFPGLCYNEQGFFGRPNLPPYGGVLKWPKRSVLKTERSFIATRGFNSLHLRQKTPSHSAMVFFFSYFLKTPIRSLQVLLRMTNQRSEKPPSPTAAAAPTAMPAMAPPESPSFGTSASQRSQMPSP